jgi:2-oxoisovalerate dehydrogenase E2 component (dihydrolipoyl transacylase)
MAVVREFLLPDLGEGLTEAEIVRWLVEVGDHVAVDQHVVEVETAKALVEVPCPYAGVVTARFGEEGTEVPVGSPLITVAVGTPETAGGAEPRPGGEAGASGPSGASGGGSGTPAGGSGGSGTGSGGTSANGGAPGHGSSSGSGGATGNGSPSGGAARNGTGGSGNVLVGYGTTGSSSRRRRVRPAGAAVPAVPGSARSVTVSEPPAQEPPATGTAAWGTPASGTAASGTAATGTAFSGSPATGPVPVISPLVRRLAREHGLDLRTLTGSGPEGLILRSDVERAVAATAPSAAPSPAAASAAALAEQHGQAVQQTAQTAQTPQAEPRALPHAQAEPYAAAHQPEATRIPLKGMRRAIAEKLSRSRREIPDATCWVDADATELLAARAAMNASGGDRVSLLAVLARITTAALARYPALNSTVDQDTQHIVHLPSVHLGFAAQTERGLVVPVIHHADRMTTAELSAAIARLTESARAGTLTPAELTGGTFTLNNYGVFGVDGSTPIINHPEAGMLGVGRITPKPWVVDGELAVRHVTQLSFTFDHRVCDGGTAGGFLRFVADCVEQPANLLRHI